MPALHHVRYAESTSPAGPPMAPRHVHVRASPPQGAPLATTGKGQMAGTPDVICPAHCVAEVPCPAIEVDDRGRDLSVRLATPPAWNPVSDAVDRLFI